MFVLKNVIITPHFHQGKCMIHNRNYKVLLYQFFKSKIPIIWTSVSVGTDCSYAEFPLTVFPHRGKRFKKKKKIHSCTYHISRAQITSISVTGWLHLRLRRSLLPKSSAAFGATATHTIRSFRSSRRRLFDFVIIPA